MANPHKGIMNVEVLSFNRLAQRVFEETGENRRTILNEVGKNFVIRKIANEQEGNLKVIGGNLRKIGYISEVKSVISEFTQYDIQPEMLDEIIEKAKDNLSLYYKLSDLRLIYQNFQAYLENKYITGEEVLNVLSLVAHKSKLLKDSVVVLDGFTGFTPVQNKLLGQLMCLCEDVAVSVTMDKRENPFVYLHAYQLFALSKHMVTSFIRLAEENQIQVKRPIYLYEEPVYRYQKNEPLAFMEHNLFRYSKEVYEKEQDAVQIWYAKRPKEEVDFVAQKVRELVRTKNYRYQDIAILTGGLDDYAQLIERIFEGYEIPFFMDHKRSILLNSFVEYLRSLLVMAEQDFSYDSVFRYLRTDFGELSQDEVDVLENYVLAFGIRGYKRWQEQWVRRAKGMSLEELQGINEIREKFVASVSGVMPSLKSRNKTVCEVTEALHSFFLEKELQKKVKEYQMQFEKAGELSLAKEYAQVYRIVIDLLDQFVELLGDERISLKEYCELLDAGLEEAKVGVIPPSIDQVIIGDVERSRIGDVKVVFLVGVNDVYIPGNVNNKGLLSEYDRQKLAENGAVLAPNVKEKTYIQKFYLYLILTKPMNQVYLTYSKSTSEGGALRPSYLISDIRKLFSELKVQEVKLAPSDRELTAESGIDCLVNGLQRRKEGLSKEWQELYSWYRRNPQWSRKIEQIVEAAFYEKPSATLTKATAEKLYGSLLTNSVSRLEKFTACAYAHFLAYGLRLQERETYQFQSLDMGNLFHSAMEHFSKKIKNAGYSWTKLSDEVKEVFIKESVEECIVDYGNTILYSSARNEYMINRLERLMRRTVWALTKQLEKGEFEPVGFEVVYDSGAISLENNHAMRVYGKIDRVDICETEDDVYVKVVDYKTGRKSFSLNEFYHGLQMQLIVYMDAALEIEHQRQPEKNITPAGFLFYSVEDPVIPKQRDDEKRDLEILKILKPDGMVNGDAEVLKRLDYDLQQGASNVVPVGRNKDGSLSKSSKVLNEEELKLLPTYAGRKMRKIGNAIMNGEAEVNPYVLGDKSACTYCKYKGICGFDEKLPGYEYRKLDKFGNGEVLEKMREEV
jgi:ATP-dependent helicase/nuclease subunit B